MQKRLISLLLCLALAISSLPLPAFAQDMEETAVSGIVQEQETEPAAAAESIPETTVAEEASDGETLPATVPGETIPEETHPEVTEETVPESTEPEASEEVPDFQVEAMAPITEMTAANMPAAASDIQTGTCGDNVTWVLKDRVLTISGTGAMNDYNIDLGPIWCSYSYNPSSQAVVDSVIIEPGITEIGEYAFFGATMSSISIPDTVTDIYAGAFGNCNNLSQLILPEGVKHIGYMSFTGSGLTEIVIPMSMEKISSAAFSDTLQWVYYPGNQPQWDSIKIYNSGGTINRINTVTKRFRYGELATIGMGFMARYDNFYCYVGDPNIYSSNQAACGYVYDTLASRRFYLEHGLTAADITWSSSNESVLKVIPTGNNVPNFQGIEPGTARITATKPDGESIWLDVTVINPIALNLGATYDANQYYYGGSFYSARSSISDSVEFYLTFENCLGQKYPCKLSEGSGMTFPPFTGVTVTATIDSEELSFLNGAAATTFLNYYDEVAFGEKVTDLLCLYPVDPDTYTVPSEGNTYTLTLKMTCDNLPEPVIVTHTFTVKDAEAQKVTSHIEFADHNHHYLVSKGNAFGKNMVGLRHDPEFIWSKWSSLDFENYSEVVMADLLIGMLDVPQGEISIVPKVLKDWHKTYKTIKSSITDIVKKDYGDVFDISESKIDKVLKASKYLESDETFAESGVYKAVQTVLGDQANVSTVRGVFQAVDKSKQVYNLVSLAKEPVKEILAWGNTLSVLNAFDEADSELKAVFRSLADAIPSSEHDMKEAVLDYVNYSHDFSGKVQEIYDSFFEAAGNVTLSAFKNTFGKKVWDYYAVKAIDWIGKIPLSSGQTLASTSAYTKLTSASAKAIGGSVLTGVSIGLTLSDLICSSSSKASEMGKLIAMSEYSPYIIQVLEQYEDNLHSARNMESVLLFENAFKLHQGAQSYIIGQTVNVLKVKGESLLFKFIGNEDYLKMAADTLVYKDNVDQIQCCTPLDESGIHTTYKMAAVQCPVNVFVYDALGQEILRIVNDQLVSNTQDLTVLIIDSRKYIVLPGDQDYNIKITATDSGSMQYDILEYDEYLRYIRRVEQGGIPLTGSKTFTGTVVAEPDVPFGSYALRSGGELYVPHDPQVIAGRENMHMLRLYNPNNGEHFYTGSTVERDNLAVLGWQYEGVGFTFPMNAGDPVHRLFDPVNDDHLYTMDTAEVDRLMAKGWNYEGIAFNSATGYEVPQYRLHNPNARSGAWHFTGSEEERDMLISLGWEYQGIGWYSCWG